MTTGPEIERSCREDCCTRPLEKSVWPPEENEGEPPLPDLGGECLVITGVPADRSRDGELAKLAIAYAGTKVICGGTTAAMISRESGLLLRIDLPGAISDVPPAGKMEGFALITEGILTLTKVRDLLQAGLPAVGPCDPAVELARLLVSGRSVRFIVGSGLNATHYDPDLPVILPKRADLVEEISLLLKELFGKKVVIDYFDKKDI